MKLQARSEISSKCYACNDILLTCLLLRSLSVIGFRLRYKYENPSANEWSHIATLIVDGLRVMFVNGMRITILCVISASYPVSRWYAPNILNMWIVMWWYDLRRGWLLKEEKNRFHESRSFHWSRLVHRYLATQLQKTDVFSLPQKNIWFSCLVGSEDYTWRNSVVLLTECIGVGNIEYRYMNVNEYNISFSINP